MSEERYFKFENLMADLAAYLVSEYDIEPRDAAHGRRHCILQKSLSQNNE